MQKYRETLVPRGSGSSKTGPVTECQNWEDLALLVEQAEEEYENQGGSVRRLSRKVGDYQSALRELAGLLPGNSKFWVVSRGVNMLLSVSAEGRIVSAHC